MHILDNYFDTEKVKGYCNKAFLEAVYMQYLYNLKLSPYKLEWSALDEISMPQLNEWTCVGDKYLKDSKDDHSKLALDIYENGTYYPLIVGEGDHTLYRLRDGIHRLHSMLWLKDEGLWTNDRKVLVMTDSFHDNYESGQELTYHLPMMVAEGFKENYRFLYDELEAGGEIKYVDDNHHFAEYRTRLGGFLASACISLLLRNAMFDYRENTGDIIKPSEVINDYDAWLEWRGF